MVKVQQVFDAAIHLMDEQAETNGATDTTDTNEYRYRTISILNTLIPALYPFSDTYDNSAAGRPVCPQLTLPNGYKNPDFQQFVPLDDTLALAVLPYELASLLLAGEDSERSALFHRQYTQVFADIRSKIPASFEPIPMPYGSF
jgi:hypothetical protein